MQHVKREQLPIVVVSKVFCVQSALVRTRFCAIGVTPNIFYMSSPVCGRVLVNPRLGWGLQAGPLRILEL